MTDNDRNQRHKERMQRKKAVIDERVRQADEERGVVVVLTGTGKGKSSSAFGMVARALGHGMRVGVAQFIKGKWQSGEEKLFADHPEVEFVVMGTGFTWNTQDREADMAAARTTWQKAEAMLRNPELGLVVLDELTYMFKFDYLPQEPVLEAIRNRPPQQHVVITGRGANEALLALADTVSEVHNVKHAYKAGVKAQPGVDW